MIINLRKDTVYDMVLLGKSKTYSVLITNHDFPSRSLTKYIIMIK